MLGLDSDRGLFSDFQKAVVDRFVEWLQLVLELGDSLIEQAPVNTFWVVEINSLVQLLVLFDNLVFIKVIH